jgi:hypothetical protein
MENAAEHLQEGETYTLSRILVGGFWTQVWLEEVPGIAFNSVHFDNGDFDPIMVAARRAYIMRRGPGGCPYDSAKVDLRETIEVVKAICKDLMYSDAEVEDPDDDNGFNIMVMLLSAAIVGPDLKKLIEFTGLAAGDLAVYFQQAVEGGVFTDDGKIACNWFDPETGSTALMMDALVVQGLLNRG